LASTRDSIILALDQGTSSSRAILFDRAGTIVDQRSRELTQHYPRPGWVEHDPEEIWESQLEVARQVLAKRDLSGSDVAALGIANQRETTIVWERATGKPIYNAIVWQDRRTAELCDRLRAAGWKEEVRRRTGLVIDPYFSATKIRWILDKVEGANARARRGELLFGTVDSFLIYRLTGGKLHVTDYSNASRTMLYNIHTLDWDDDLLKELGIPRSMLPELKPSSGLIGESLPELFKSPIPIAGCAGDQQAAMFGQGCFREGMVKNTYGTGNFMLMNTGSRVVQSTSGLVPTVAWGVAGTVTYALEGSAFVTGAAVQWLRDGLQIIASADETEVLATSVPDTGGVFFVPAFAGLGAPHWDASARGAIVGLTGGATRAHIVRAALEAAAYQSVDLLDAMRRDSGLNISDIRVDGGMVENDFLMQFQADVAGATVRRPAIRQMTALGAAYLAGLGAGYWGSQDELGRLRPADRIFEPRMDPARRSALLDGWRRAVDRSRNWATLEA
jgi:glycerol kinase